MHPWTALFLVARDQHGAVTRAQAAEVGIPLSTFDARVRREGWPARHRVVRLVPGTEPTALTEISAALLAVGGGAIATARTGLFLHGVIARPPPTIELVTSWTGSARRLPGVRVLRSRTLLEEDRCTRQRLAVASAQRCYLDLARQGGPPQWRALLIDGRQRCGVDPLAVVDRAAQHRGVPGSRLLADVALEIACTGADSILSHRVHRRLVDHGLQPDDVPVSVPIGPQGRVLHPDITFAWAKVGIECDSLGYHGTQRAIDLDHRKDQAYRQVGWDCPRIGWYRFDHDWLGFVRDLDAALDRAGVALGLR